MGVVDIHVHICHPFRGSYRDLNSPASNLMSRARLNSPKTYKTAITPPQLMISYNANFNRHCVRCLLFDFKNGCVASINLNYTVIILCHIFVYIHVIYFLQYLQCADLEGGGQGTPSPLQNSIFLHLHYKITKIRPRPPPPGKLK